MNPDADWQAIAHEEMRFFGNVSAAISHEINNRIAVINEKAGLMEDLAMMLAQGREVDPGRFEVQSRKIVEQVRQAKKIVNSLNRFAHSVDVQHSRIQVAEVVEFVVELYARKAAMAEASLSVAKPSDLVVITTSPFLLQTLIGRGIDVALSRIGESRAVAIGVEATRDGARVRFAGLAGLADPVELPETGPGLYEILEWYGARFRSEPDGTAMLLEIPGDEGKKQGGTV